MSSIIRALGIGALVALAACATTDAKDADGGRTANARKMPVPEYLPVTVRATLASRMHRHGDDMNDLLWSVLFLDYVSTHEIAEHIAGEPRVARPVEGQDPGDLNALLPETFFRHQDRLVELAGQLAAAAKSDNGGAVAESYGQLAETCVSCHIAYLSMPPERAPSP